MKESVFVPLEHKVAALWMGGGSPHPLCTESAFCQLLLGAGVAPLRDLELAVNRHSLQS